MGFFQNLLGTNQKYSTANVASDYNAAYKPAMDAAKQVGDLGQDLLDPNSQFNLNKKATINAQGQDAAAEANRKAERLVAMGGGAPAAAIAAQNTSNVNKTIDASNQAFNDFVSGSFDKGVGMITSSANNITSMKENKMNAINAQRDRNNQIDSAAAGAIANFGGQALEQFVPGLSFFSQEGGEVPYYFNQGGFISRLLGKKSMQPMPSQEEIDAMKGYESMDNYHYQDMRRPIHRMDSDPERLPVPIAQDYEPHRIRGDEESYNPKEDTRLQSDGTLYNQKEEEWQALKEDILRNAGPARRHRELPVNKQSGGMISQVMGPKGPMTIPTRLGGYQFGK